MPRGRAAGAGCKRRYLLLTVREALNRGLNFFGVATLAVLATSVVHGIGLPYGVPHATAEIAFGLVAAAGIVWYLVGRNRYRRSAAPLVFLMLGLLAKFGGAFGSYGQVIPAGSDLGIAFLLVVTITVWAWQFWTLPE